MPSTTTTGTVVLAVLLVVVSPVVSLSTPAADSGEELSAHFEPERVDNTGPDTYTSLVVDAPADDAIYVDSSSFDAEELQDVFGGEIVGERVRVPLPSDGHVEADFYSYRPGEAKFTVTGVDSGVSDTATISIVTTALPVAQFRNTVVVAAPNETARATIQHDPGWRSNSTSVRVEMRSEERGPLLTANLSVDSDQEMVDLFVDLERTGQESAALTVENATLENVTSHTGREDRPFGVGEYTLGLSVDGDEVDIAVLVVREPTPTETPVPTETPTGTGTGEPTESETQTATSPATSPSPSENGTDAPETVPGFGAVVAVLAVAGWLAVRRA